MQDERIACRLRIEHHTRRYGDNVLPSVIDLWVGKLALYADKELREHLCVGTGIDETELVPIQTIERELARDILENALGDLAQNDVADLVVERFVDRTEIVDAHDEEATAAACLTCLAQSIAQILDKLIAVEKAGNGICRVAARKLADRPNEEIRYTILGGADPSLEPQP